MRITSTWRRRRPATHSFLRNPASWILAIASITPLAQAITITPVASPNLDLGQLGRTGIAGDFNGISLYQFEGQTEQTFSANGSETLMTQLPTGQLINVLAADASIQTMCLFSGLLILGGNFTSLGGKEFTAIAAMNMTTATPVPLVGLTGQVNSVLCDNDANMVYVGGSFQAGNISTNAITWVGNNGWTGLPFAGFNGPVTSIVKAANGHIIFGGGFTGLGNTTAPSQPDEQVINLSTATISQTQGANAAGFSDPKNIVCKTGGVDGPGNTWLLQDNTPGTWRAKFNFGFQPTKLRLYNTHQEGRGTKTWRYTALPINGIMNFTYVDPVTKQNKSCTSECPLSDDKSIKFQDFVFVNKVGMNEFKIDVSAWYGNGGGLNGVELFEDDIYAYAINDFNEPACGGRSFASKSTATGPWSVTPSGLSNSDYLTTKVTGTSSSSPAAVTFFPDIEQSGSYVVSVYTPGCLQDNTCASRGQVNVTWSLTANGKPGSKILYQTNNFEKYDTLDSTLVDAASDSFRPSITISPASGQDTTNLTVVAQRVGFTVISTTGGLRGLFEFDPSKATVDSADFDSSTFDKLGSSFGTSSAVASLAVNGDRTYIGGNFSSSGVKNIVAVDTARNATVELDGGLNGAVSSIYVSGSQVFVGGTFNNTQSGSVTGLSNVAVYDSNSNKWSALGAGVNGAVVTIAPMSLNISSTTPEEVIVLTGNFKSLLGFSGNAEVAADGFAVWVKSKGNWLQNLSGSVPELNGRLTTSLLGLSSGTALYAGTISSQALGAKGVVTMGNTLGTFPVNIKPTTPSTSNTTTNVGLAKRASLINDTDAISGVISGAFYLSGDRNITILGGHFSATTTSGSAVSNLVFIDGANKDTVTGLPSGITDDSKFLALAVQGDNLWAGGVVNGTVSGSAINGLVTYSLANAKFNPQPPALAGGRGVVTAIRIRSDTGDVYVGGSFRAAGSLDCPGVCMFATSNNQWSRPGLGFQGDVSSMIWSGTSTLIAGGDLQVNNSGTYLASYDASGTSWKSFPAASSLPGPVDAITIANSDGSQLWVAGTVKGGTKVYLMKYDGSAWKSLGVNLDGNSVISSLQVFTVTSSHESSDLIDANQVLMITGSLNIPGFGTASSALFNGTTLQPYALTSNTGGAAGSIAKIFVEKPDNFFNSSGGGLALGFVVLIALAISLALMLLIVVAGLVLDRYRKKREGYVPAPTSMYDRDGGMKRIPPGELLDSLGKGRSGAPHI